MNNSEIAQELKIALLYRDENDGAVKRIAGILGLARRTVYDYLDGNIKINLAFLHAAVIATNGDRDVKKFLEPQGWELTPNTGTANPAADIEREMGDVHVASGILHNEIRSAMEDGQISNNERARISKRITQLCAEIQDVSLAITGTSPQEA